jgi:hypothetical protein
MQDSDHEETVLLSGAVLVIVAFLIAGFVFWSKGVTEASGSKREISYVAGRAI